MFGKNSIVDFLLKICHKNVWKKVALADLFIKNL
jgi:hypothetical protein